MRAMKRRLADLAGAVLYMALVSVPLLVALLPPRPPARSFWFELAIALGFIGLGQIALEFALVGRFQAISRPCGIDLVMQLHRQIGLLAAAIVVVHPLILAALHPVYRTLLNPLAGSTASRTGWLSVIALGSLVAVTLGRRRVRLAYEAWRLAHALLAVAALGLAFAHVALAGRYLAAPWKAAAVGAYCALFAGLVVHLRLLRPLALRRRPYRVVAVRADAAETWAVAVAPVGHAGLRFAPGQFAWVRFAVSPWSLREHPFSFSSSAEAPGRLEFGIKELGDFTRTIGRLPAGAPVYVDGPHGSFSCDFAPAAGFLFVAGGIGASPVLSMLRTLADRGDARPHALVYACSRWDRVAFRAEVEALRERLDLDVVYVLEQGHEGWQGPTGYVTDDLLRPLVRSRDGAPRTAFVCGPERMLAAVEASLLRCGVPADRIEMEKFHLA